MRLDDADMIDVEPPPIDVEPPPNDENWSGKLDGYRPGWERTEWSGVAVEIGDAIWDIALVMCAND